MKVTGYILVQKGYALVISADQWKDNLLRQSEEYNEEQYGETYLSKPKERAVVSVEFEVPNSVFERPKMPVLPGGVVKK